MFYSTYFLFTSVQCCTGHICRLFDHKMGKQSKWISQMKDFCEYRLESSLLGTQWENRLAVRRQSQCVSVAACRFPIPSHIPRLHTSLIQDKWFPILNISIKYVWSEFFWQITLLIIFNGMDITKYFDFKVESFYNLIK